MTIDVVQEYILIGLPRTSSNKHERCCVAVLFSTRELFHKWEGTGIVADVDDTIEARVSYDGHIVLHTDGAKEFDRAFILDEKVRDAT